MTLVSFNSAAKDAALSARFDETGGSIGRSKSNHLVLPDPDFTISRVHAQIIFRDGSFWIVDQGSNPVMVNGHAVGVAGERLLHHGDLLQIGSYVLRVQSAPAEALLSPAHAANAPISPTLASIYPRHGADVPQAWSRTEAQARPGQEPPVTAEAIAPDSAEAVLVQALLKGLQMPQLQLQHLTPELLHLIGELLYEAASGTVELLQTRAATKRDVRAETTVITARANNPLKFSPSAEAALQHLLAPPSRGFMPAVPALRDAYADLRAHQFGFVAGMRAALENLLQRFDPRDFEAQLDTRPGLLPGLPGSQRARLWELYVERYEQISAAAEADFHSLLGQAFQAAYDEQVQALKRSPD
ncbi:type VI secretion system-associated FHA domain protein TagH [Pelomonas sp. SE-A7]|uniref:type VI secretion system-associated FHA domain protein TagH n=1 Tax=Pelomonas sp. SE-A7 TaxID=3054953 RepID=UPI00259CC277|nr:type VI secretion system-associated FHA domain protein TagH [Pelomonas sp. SE-A7]MDM4764730.1 type VI secretion system-associated FHA domain protein TagH [Pelomonas sp. SE-A7]